MKEGALVECIDNNGLIRCSPLKLNTVYTIRQIRHTIWDTGVTVLLNEVKSPTNFTGIEYGYKIHRFREIHYNTSAISELLEERKVEKG